MDKQPPQNRLTRHIGIAIAVLLFIILLSASPYMIPYLLSINGIKIDPIDGNTFWGTFISLCTTFIVGFQIWNYIYSSEKLEAFDKEKKNLMREIQELKQAKNECMYFNAYTIGRMRFQMAEGYRYKETDRKYYWNALRALANALRYAQKGGHDFDDTFQSIAGKICSAINKIARDENHLINKDDDRRIYLDMAEEIQEYMDEVVTFIQTSCKHKSRYKTFLDHTQTWKDLAASLSKSTA